VGQLPLIVSKTEIKKILENFLGIRYESSQRYWYHSLQRANDEIQKFSKNLKNFDIQILI